MRNRTDGDLQEVGCALCGNDRPLTFHHLIPRTCHRNKWFRKNFDKEDMKTRGIDLCRGCHSFIHRHFSEKELGRHFNTLEALRANDLISNHVAWARRQK